jgi:hypothetical protein
MRIAEENWNVLASLFPTGWLQMARQSGAVERLRGFRSPDMLLRTLLLHVARGYSLPETVVHANLANWADISDVALLKRLRNSEEWLRLLCIELLRENVTYGLRRAFQSYDPDCGWHDRQRTRQDREPMEDSVQHQTAEFGVRLFRGDGHDRRRQRRVIELPA